MPSAPSVLLARALITWGVVSSGRPPDLLIEIRIAERGDSRLDSGAQQEGLEGLRPCCVHAFHSIRVDHDRYHDALQQRISDNERLQSQWLFGGLLSLESQERRHAPQDVGCPVGGRANGVCVLERGL